METPKPMGSRARTIEDKEQRRRLLLEAAKTLFFDRGLQGATIEMITTEVGLSPGAFYGYFKSKLEIYLTLYSEAIDIFHDMAKQAISWPGMTALARISAIISAYHRFYIDHTEYFDILAFMHIRQEEFKQPSHMSSMLDEKALKLLRMLEGVIKEGVESGELAPIDTWKATNVLWGMMDGLMALAERKNLMFIEVELEELIRQALEIVFYGMAKRNDAPAPPST